MRRYFGLFKSNNDHHPQTTDLKAIQGGRSAVHISHDGMYNLEMLYELGGREYVSQVVAIFLRDASKELCEMKDAVTKGDSGSICASAHKLKGSSGVIKANNFSILLEQIETTAGMQNNKSMLQEQVRNVIAEFDKMKPSLQSVIKE